MKKINDFDTQIQSDELAAKNGEDWFNDFDDIEDDDEYDND